MKDDDDVHAEPAGLGDPIMFRALRLINPQIPVAETWTFYKAAIRSCRRLEKHGLTEAEASLILERLADINEFDALTDEQVAALARDLLPVLRASGYDADERAAADGVADVLQALMDGDDDDAARGATP